MTYGLESNYTFIKLDNYTRTITVTSITNKDAENYTIYMYGESGYVKVEHHFFLLEIKLANYTNNAPPSFAV